MKEPKQIAYFYDNIFADEETELDLDGIVTLPAKGDTHASMAERHGESSM